jgi:hypothetical protein
MAAARNPGRGFIASQETSTPTSTVGMLNLSTGIGSPTWQGSREICSRITEKRSHLNAATDTVEFCKTYFDGMALMELGHEETKTTLNELNRLNKLNRVRSCVNLIHSVCFVLCSKAPEYLIVSDVSAVLQLQLAKQHWICGLPMCNGRNLKHQISLLNNDL